jgi:hypothetical protein
MEAAARARLGAGGHVTSLPAKANVVRSPRVFAARLRDQVSLDAIDEGLRAVVAGPTQPAHVSLWVRCPETSR